MTKQCIVKEMKIAAAALGVGLIISLIFCTVTKAYSEREMEKITSEVFRFHILADDDSEEAQALKLALRDEILEDYKDFLTSSPSKAETMAFFGSHLSEIEEKGEEFFKERGLSTGVKAEIGKSSFPLRKYGEFTLPAGVYDCLKISIGRAEGHNWWCVMFPPLCYVKGTCEEAEEGVYKEDLSEEVYDIITGESKSASPEVKIKLKIIEFWQNR